MLKAKLICNTFSNTLFCRYGEGEEDQKSFHHIEEVLLDCMGNKVSITTTQYLDGTC